MKGCKRKYILLKGLLINIIQKSLTTFALFTKFYCHRNTTLNSLSLCIQIYNNTHKIWRKHSMMCLHVQLPFNGTTNNIHMECDQVEKSSISVLKNWLNLSNFPLLCYGR